VQRLHGASERYADSVVPAAARDGRGSEDHDDRRARGPATALLARTPKPTDAQIDNDMAANICRCGTYTRIRKAIHSAADKIAKGGGAS